MNVFCLFCKVEFYVRPSYLKRRRGKYCSKKCNGLAHTKSKVSRLCIICNKSFTIKEYRIKLGEGKYCSCQCQYSSMKRGTIAICIICKREFYSKRGEQKRNKGKFCSSICVGQWTKQNKSGKNSSSWKGGRGQERHRIMARSEYRKWRKMVLKRDHYKCQICGTSSSLSVNHIKKWADYPKLRYDLNNGISICMICHYQKINHHEKEWENYFYKNLKLHDKNIRQGTHSQENASGGSILSSTFSSYGES